MADGGSPAPGLAAVFAVAMDEFGPFEPAPRLAVALSGGADSTALLLLAVAWACARGGSATALTVDHGLRPESAAEAAALARRCAARGVAHATLVWAGTKPASAIQAEARRARYALLEAWCREAGVLHLLLGHHADDQAETAALRAERGSGPDGVAGMAACRETLHARLLRPLLAVPGAASRGFLAARGESWFEDPSNADPRFARARLRRAGAVPPPDPAAGAARVARERSLAVFLARHAAPSPAGAVALDRTALVAVAPALAASALGRAIAAVGGHPQPPRGARLAALAAACASRASFPACTLGGCRIRDRRGRIEIVRERTPARGLDAVGSAAHLVCGRDGGGLDTVAAVFVPFRSLRPLAGAPFAPVAGVAANAAEPRGERPSPNPEPETGAP